MSNQKQVMTELRKLRKQIAKKKWLCMYDGCKEEAIKSHILQRHGILDNITEDNHMYELRPKDIFRWDANMMPMEFRKVGINEAISQPLFCSHHDTDVFIDIEKVEPNLSVYRNQLLFTYRTVCSEIHKKNFEIAFNRRLKSDQNLTFDKGPLNNIIKGYEHGIDDLKTYENLLLGELKNPTNAFIFNLYNFPFIPIYASSPFSFETDKSKLISSTSTWTGAFFHMIPLPRHTQILVGYHKDYNSADLQKFLSLWNTKDMKKLGINLTDLFSQRIESFGMSIPLYKSLKQENIGKFFDFMKESFETYNMKRQPDFNLFEGSVWNSITCL